MNDITTIFFDLDGTLLPMDQEVFTKTYFQLLTKKLLPYGYEPQKLMSAIWSGITAMIKNDGSLTNEAVFWNAFLKIFGEKALHDKPIFEAFYINEFQNVKNACGFTPLSAAAIHALRSRGFRTVLATNPIFPSVATNSRIRWAGLLPEDFEFCTTYENSRHCKPNPAYYQDILDRLHLAAQNCLMVGNDVSEDMIAETLGMKVFLLTDCLINRENKNISVYPQGSFAQLLDFLS